MKICLVKQVGMAVQCFQKYANSEKPSIGGKINAFHKENHLGGESQRKLRK